jgi:hypothetical protein
MGLPRRTRQANSFNWIFHNRSPGRPITYTSTPPKTNAGRIAGRLNQVGDFENLKSQISNFKSLISISKS